MELQGTQRMIKGLQNLKKRYCSIFFSKLVLLDSQSSLEDSHIRHYDLQCEAAQNIFSLLDTKIRTLSLRAFYTLRIYTEQKVHTPVKNKKSYYRSNVGNAENSFSRLSNERNALSSISLYHPLSIGHKQIYLRPKQRNIRLEINTNPEIQELDKSISALMGRVKNLSDRFNRRNNKNFMSNQQIDKLTKRKLILSKLNQLQNDLSTFLQRDEQRQRSQQRYLRLCQTPSEQTANFLSSSRYSQKLNMTTQTRYQVNEYDYTQDNHISKANHYVHQQYHQRYKNRFKNREKNQQIIRPKALENKDRLYKLSQYATTQLKRPNFFN